MTTTLTRRELNLAIFQGKADAVLWQPRLETWWGDRKRRGATGEPYTGLGYWAFYDALHCSMRYIQLDCYGEKADPLVIRKEHTEGDLQVCTITTPKGMLTTHYRIVYDGERIANQRIEKYPVTTVKDLRIATDLMERADFWSNADLYLRNAAKAGHRTEPTLMLPGAGFTDLIKQWCGLEETFYLMADAPEEVAAFVNACDGRDDRLLEAVLSLPCQIYNLGDHATNEFTPPGVIEKFMIPRWQRLSERIHQHGKFCHSHWDGNARAILPYLEDTGLDAIEALTPEPQGDITLEQIKAAVGDHMIVLDLIPAIYFLEQYKTSEVLDFTQRVIDLFAPRLILGISDEISEIGQIEKVAAITELVDQNCGLAR